MSARRPSPELVLERYSQLVKVVIGNHSLSFHRYIFKRTTFLDYDRPRSPDGAYIVDCDPTSWHIVVSWLYHPVEIEKDAFPFETLVEAYVVALDLSILALCDIFDTVNELLDNVERPPFSWFVQVDRLLGPPEQEQEELTVGTFQHKGVDPLLRALAQRFGAEVARDGFIPYARKEPDFDRLGLHGGLGMALLYEYAFDYKFDERKSIPEGPADHFDIERQRTPAIPDDLDSHNAKRVKVLAESNNRNLIRRYKPHRESRDSNRTGQQTPPAEPDDIRQNTPQMLRQNDQQSVWENNGQNDQQSLRQNPH